MSATKPFRLGNYIRTPADLAGFIVEFLREPCTHDELLHALRSIREVLEGWE